MTEELYKRHRPEKFSQLVGQDAAVRMLTELGKRKAIPHTILFSGPSGCGKTTIARILRRKLGCSDIDFFEKNCADFRGIDMVRDIRDQVGRSPMAGKCRAWLVDECAKLTKDAQNAFLKLLEDTPPHVYFMLATTEPEKLLRTIRTRATEVKVKLLDRRDMAKLLAQVAVMEKIEFGEEVLDKIVELAEGSPRKALVLLNQIVGQAGEDEQLAVLGEGDVSRQAVEIARALHNRATTWRVMATILKGVDEEPEGLRHMVLVYATSVLLGGGKQANRAFAVIDCFSRNFYDSKRAGLVAACYEVVTGKD